MQESISEKSMQRAAEKLAEARLDAQSGLADAEHVFSPRFELEMEKLMRKGKRRAMWHKALSMAASLFLVMVLSGGIILAASSEARAVVLTWLQERYEDVVVYHFWGSRENSGFPTYRVGWVPDGCILMDETIMDDRYYATYGTSADSTDFVFYYGTFDAMKGLTVFDDSVANAEDLTILGMPGEYTPSENASGGDLVWIDEKQQLLFILSSTLDKSTMIQIAEGITLKR